MSEILSEYHLLGLTIGVCTFIIIGIFHPITIKCEYYFGTRCWWWFLLLGIIGIGGTLLVDDVFWSSLLSFKQFIAATSFRLVYPSGAAAVVRILTLD